MKRWQWLAAVLALLIAFGALWYRYGHPKIRLATDAEVRTVVPADLLPGPPDAAAVRRFDLLNLVGGQIRTLNRSGDPDPAAIAKNAAIVEAAMKISRQGLQVANGDATTDDNVDVLTSTLDLEAKLKGRAGDSRPCEKAIADCLGLARALKRAGGLYCGYTDGVRTLDQASETATFCIRKGWLKAAELRSLIRELPESGPADRDLVGFYRSRLWSYLFDSEGILHLVERPATAASTEAVDDLSDAGNFDALQTAKLLAELHGEWIANAARPWNDQLQPVETRFSKLVSELPKRPISGISTVWAPYGFTKPRSPSVTEKLGFVMAMNSIANSHALAIFSNELGFGSLMRSRSVKLDNEQRILRILAAMWAYREEHTRAFPSDLQELVTDRYLDRIPTDAFTDQPLSYDPKRRIISTGEDGPAWSLVQDISPLPISPPPAHKT